MSLFVCVCVCVRACVCREASQAQDAAMQANRYYMFFAFSLCALGSAWGHLPYGWCPPTGPETFCLLGVALPPWGNYKQSGRPTTSLGPCTERTEVLPAAPWPTRETIEGWKPQPSLASWEWLGGEIALSERRSSVGSNPEERPTSKARAGGRVDTNTGPQPGRTPRHDPVLNVCVSPNNSPSGRRSRGCELGPPAVGAGTSAGTRT